MIRLEIWDIAVAYDVPPWLIATLDNPVPRTPRNRVRWQARRLRARVRRVGSNLRRHLLEVDDWINHPEGI